MQTKEEYLEQYNAMKNSKSVNNLINWKLDNHDEPFQEKDYIDNFKSLVSDVVATIDNMGKDNKNLET